MTNLNRIAEELAADILIKYDEGAITAALHAGADAITVYGYDDQAIRDEMADALADYYTEA